VDGKIKLVFCIEVLVPSQEGERLCICVLGVSILSLSAILIFYFRIVRGNFCLSLYYFFLWSFYCLSYFN